MNKVVAFLESYVEWIAVGLGALLLLWVGYASFVTPQAVATVDGVVHGPGEVDVKIKEDADSLAALTQSHSTLPPAALELLRSATAEESGEQSAKLPPLAPWMPTIGGQSVTPRSSSDPLPIVEGAGDLAMLPKLDPAHIEKVSSGMAFVEKVVAASRAPQPGQVGDVASGAGVPAAAPAGPTADLTWVRVEYQMPAAQLNAAFVRARIPRAMQTLTIAQVRLVRERQLTDGSFGEQVELPPIGSVQLQPIPQGDAIDAGAAFRDFASSSFAMIVRPPFYPVRGGVDPTTSAPVIVQKPGDPAQATPFDPAVWLDTPREQRVPPTINDLSPDQRRAVAAEQKRRADEKKAQQPPRPSGPRGGGGRGGGGGGRGLLADDPGRPPFLQPAGANGDEGMFPGTPGYPGASGFPGGPNGQSTDGNFPPLPTIPIDLAAAANFTCWAYDETAEPNQTYRYAVKYWIINPIWNTQNVAQNPNDAKQLVIESPLSEWSEPVTTERALNLFVAQKFAPAAPNIKVRLFKFHEGAPRGATFTVSPGDPVGGNDGGVQYDSGWTLVDIRGDDRSAYVIFLDEKGQLVRRDAETDASDPVRRSLEAPPAPVVAPQFPGGPGEMGP